MTVLFARLRCVALVGFLAPNAGLTVDYDSAIASDSDSMRSLHSSRSIVTEAEVHKGPYFFFPDEDVHEDVTMRGSRLSLPAVWLTDKEGASTKSMPSIEPSSPLKKTKGVRLASEEPDIIAPQIPQIPNGDIQSVKRDSDDLSDSGIDRSKSLQDIPEKKKKGGSKAMKRQARHLGKYIHKGLEGVWRRLRTLSRTESVEKTP